MRVKAGAKFLTNLLLVLLLVAAPARAAESLEQAVAERVVRVTEFQFIRREAEKMGLRVWLFGGTAAGFGHYVKWDLAREAGDRRFQPDRFDYDYTNIYRSTQDLDIVIDGSPEQVAKLQEVLEEKFPHFQGVKTAWEVRSLRHKTGDKEALLNNPDFLNQHTDSNSTGMIEITKPAKGEPVIRDLRAWADPSPAFLSDLKNDKLHFYFSPSHFSTNRAKEGMNPPILAALRYLTKAFQYELDIDSASLAHIQKIINDFDPKKDLTTEYARKQLEKNAKKMIQHAVNLEYAHDWLDRLGLRKKLIPLGDVKEIDSMAWWLNKMPLKSKPVGAGKEKTAAEIAREEKWKVGPKGEIVVAHETDNFLAYESITRAHTGEPNVLISRDGFAGEAAVHGDGFYTKLGRTGAAGTGITIRFELDPTARLGTDFTVKGDYVLLLNKNAIRVIPESLNLDPVSYFRFLAVAEGVDESDKALMEKLGRRVRARLKVLDSETLDRVRRVVLEEFRANGLKNAAVFSEWFRIPESVTLSGEILEAAKSKLADRLTLLSLQEGLNHWESRSFLPDLSLAELYQGFSKLDYDHKKNSLLKELVSKYSDPKRISPKDLAAAKGILLDFIKTAEPNRMMELLIEHWFSLPWAFDPGFEEVALAMQSNERLHKELLSILVKQEKLGFLKKYPELIQRAPPRGVTEALSYRGVAVPMELLDHFIDSDPKKIVDFRIAENLGGVAKHPRFGALVSRLIERGASDPEIARAITFLPEAAAHPEWVDELLRRGKANDQLLGLLMNTQIWKPNPRWLTKLLQNTGEASNHFRDREFARLLSDPAWRKLPEWRGWVDRLIAKETPTDGLLANRLVGPADINALLAKNIEEIDEEIVKFLMKELNSPQADTFAEFRDSAWVRARLETVVQRGTRSGDNAILREVMSNPKWAKETAWVEQIIQRGFADYSLAEHVLSQPHSAKHPDWLGSLLLRGVDGEKLGALDEHIDHYVLSKDHWRKHPEILEATGGKKMGAFELRMRFRRPGDPAPLFRDAAKRYWGLRPQNRSKLLQSYSAEDLRTLALAPVDRDHVDSYIMETVRALAQRTLLQRKDPRVAEWIRADLKRTTDSGRLNFLSAVGVFDPAVEKVVLDFWQEIQLLDADERWRWSNLLLGELDKSVQPKDKSMLPIAIASLETPGEKWHAIRFGGVNILSRLELKPDPQLRRALINALDDGNRYVRSAALENLERLAESSPEYIEKIRRLHAKEGSLEETDGLKSALARVSKLSNCPAGFAALTGN